MGWNLLVSLNPSCLIQCLPGQDSTGAQESRHVQSGEEPATFRLEKRRQCVGGGVMGDMPGVSGHLQISERSHVERLTLLMWPHTTRIGLQEGERYSVTVSSLHTTTVHLLAQPAP